MMFPRFLLVATTAFAAATAWAEYTGPSTQKPATTIAEVLKDPIDDQAVVLKGHLTKKVGKEKYMFADGTGEIRVEIDDKDFPAQKVDEKTRIEIRGDVEKDFMESPEIDVDAITPIAK